MIDRLKRFNSGVLTVGVSIVIVLAALLGMAFVYWVGADYYDWF